MVSEQRCSSVKRRWYISQDSLYDHTVRSSALVSNMEERERKSAESSSKEVPPEPEAECATDNINVCSEKFDPLLALYSPSAPPLPFPNIKCFNNVSEYESFLKGGRGRAKPENVEKKRRRAMKGVADPERINRLKRLMVNNPPAAPEGGESSGSTQRRKQKVQKNVVTRMTRRFRRYAAVTVE